MSPTANPSHRAILIDGRVYRRLRHLVAQRAGISTVGMAEMSAVVGFAFETLLAQPDFSERVLRQTVSTINQAIASHPLMRLPAGHAQSTARSVE